jgi:hypothetical protein
MTTLRSSTRTAVYRFPARRTATDSGRVRLPQSVSSSTARRHIGDTLTTSTSFKLARHPTRAISAVSLSHSPVIPFRNSSASPSTTHGVEAGAKDCGALGEQASPTIMHATPWTNDWISEECVRLTPQFSGPRNGPPAATGWCATLTDAHSASVWRLDHPEPCQCETGARARAGSRRDAARCRRTPVPRRFPARQ